MYTHLLQNVSRLKRTPKQKYEQILVAIFLKPKLCGRVYLITLFKNLDMQKPLDSKNSTCFTAIGLSFLILLGGEGGGC